jgi:glycosyltransferase involved in cell wall biosynthesis
VKILVVVHAFPPDGRGGTESYAEAVARGLLARGHEVSVFAGSLEWRERFEQVRGVDSGLPVARVHRSDLYFDHWDKVFEPRVAQLFEEELARARPDVVHLHQWIRLGSDLVRRAAARGVPALVHLHDLFTTCPRVFRVRPDAGPGAGPFDLVTCDEPVGRAACLHCVPRWRFQSDAEIGASIERYAAEAAAEAAAAAVRVAPSRSHRSTLLRFLAPAQPSIEVLGHPRLPSGVQGRGVDAGSPAGRLRLLFFSQLVPIKGAHVLLAALRRLGAGSGVSLDAHGPFATQEYEARLRALAEGLEVRFHGEYAQDEPCRTPADAAVIPTLARESWSFWLDEAGRLGLPIVASAAGAIAERATGRVVLVPPGDEAALAAAIAELRDRPERRRALAAGPAPEGMALEEHLVRVEALLEQAVRRGAPAVPPRPDPAELCFEWDRRELAFRELLRSQGWEETVRGQGAEIERLKREIADLRSEKGGGRS